MAIGTLYGAASRLKKAEIARRGVVANRGATVSAFKRQIADERRRASAVGGTGATRTTVVASRQGAATVSKAGATLVAARDAIASGAFSPGRVAVPETQPGGRPPPLVDPAPAFPPDAPVFVPELVPPGFEPSEFDAGPSESLELETDAFSLPTTTEITEAAARVPQWAWIVGGLVLVGGVALFLRGDR